MTNLTLSAEGALSAMPTINDSIKVELETSFVWWRRGGSFERMITGRVAEIDLAGQTITVGSWIRTHGLKPPVTSLTPGGGTKFHVSNYQQFIEVFDEKRADTGLFEYRHDVLGFRVTAPWPGPVRRFLWRILGVHIHREKCCACERDAKKITAAGYGLCDDHEWHWQAALPGSELMQYLEMSVRERARKRAAAREKR